ncbi:MAG: chemotaxis protein CheW [Candidatus Sericytochromatia bacterium]|uniref:Chemotaxis protein CheW n=1 Tax=Candidatus Tanganyikabacteria bacterium TaxID=2961651 RepID=A0A937X2E7_9BACT|nr:chemotaxis protein CheW [Candidatus Tanganyikabacteria bacterium]
MSEIRLVYFRMDAIEAALPASQVESVIDAGSSCPVTVGGRPLHVTDVRQVFRMPPGTAGASRRVLVVRRGERRFGLRVDDLGELRTADTVDFRPLPAVIERLRPTPALVAILCTPDPVFVLDAWRLPGALTSIGRVGLPVKDAP